MAATEPLTVLPDEGMAITRLDEHDPSCRRCAVLVAAKVVDRVPGFDSPMFAGRRTSLEDRILQVARWIVGEDKL